MGLDDSTITNREGNELYRGSLHAEAYSISLDTAAASTEVVSTGALTELDANVDRRHESEATALSTADPAQPTVKGGIRISFRWWSKRLR
jgi:hypothetical protein